MQLLKAVLSQLIHMGVEKYMSNASVSYDKSRLDKLFARAMKDSLAEILRNYGEGRPFEAYFNALDVRLIRASLTMFEDEIPKCLHTKIGTLLCLKGYDVLADRIFLKHIEEIVQKFTDTLVTH